MTKQEDERKRLIRYHIIQKNRVQHRKSVRLKLCGHWLKVIWEKS